MGINWLPSPASYVFALTRPRRRTRTRYVYVNRAEEEYWRKAKIAHDKAKAAKRAAKAKAREESAAAWRARQLEPIAATHVSHLPYPAGDRVGSTVDAPTCDHPRWRPPLPYCGHSDCINFRPKELGKW